MSYLSVLPLKDAKDYLRIDDGQNEDDAGIVAMITAACRYVERRSNHLFFARDKQYILAGLDCRRVYDYPINSIVKGIDQDGADVTLTKGTNIEVKPQTLHTRYENIDSDAEILVLNVGYTDPNDVPPGLIEAVKIILSSLYYDKEADTLEDAISPAAKMIIDVERRFIV